MLVMRGEDTKMIKLGVYNIITDGYKWRHLAFYERDTPITKEDYINIEKSFNKAKSSYVAYSTSSSGFHVAGLTPLSTVSFAYLYKDLDMDLKGNCSGHVLRCNLKPHEKQELISHIDTYPVVDQLSMLYEHRFNIKFPVKQKWKSLFHIYDTLPLPYRLPPFRRKKLFWQK